MGKYFDKQTAMTTIIANMIGTGVFTSLGFQLSDIQSFGSIVALWVLGGITSLLGAYTYASLSEVYPRSGGEYTLLGKAYHPILGFSAGMVSILFGFAAPMALVALAFGKYMHIYGLSPKLSALAAIFFVASFHLVSRTMTGNFQKISTIIKLILISAFIILGYLSLDLGVAKMNIFNHSSFLADTFSMSFAGSLAYVFYAYSGWNAAIYFSDEIVESSKNIKKASVVGVSVVVVLYVLLNILFFVSTPLEMLKNKVEVGQQVAGFIWGDIGVNTITLFIAIALLSSLSSLILAGPRVAKVIGQDINILNSLAFESKGGVPLLAIALQVVIAVVFVIFSEFQQVLIYMTFLLNFFSLLSVAAVWYLHLRREVFFAFRVRLAALFFIAIYGWSTFYLFVVKWEESLIGCLTILLTIIVYFAFKKK